MYVNNSSYRWPSRHRLYLHLLTFLLPPEPLQKPGGAISKRREGSRKELHHLWVPGRCRQPLLAVRADRPARPSLATRPCLARLGLRLDLDSHALPWTQTPWALLPFDTNTMDIATLQHKHHGHCYPSTQTPWALLPFNTNTFNTNTMGIATLRHKHHGHCYPSTQTP